MTYTGGEGPPPGRPRLVSDEQVFAALAEAITEHGPHRWTLPDVADRVGLTGPALGYRFGNKRGLLLAFAAHQPGATAAYFDEVAAEAPTPAAAIVDALAGDLSLMDTRAKVANNIAMLSIDLADEELAHYASAQAKIIKAKLAELITAGGIATDGEAMPLAERIYIVWSGAVLAWAIDGQGTLDTWLRRHIHNTIAKADQA
ncbi:MAG: TetR/AcrR family transcriptional regulator [Acidimicrobiales bacterium]